MGLLTKEIEQAPCTVEISHKFESLHAHVRFNNGAVIYPGDEVKVQGPEIMAPFGEIVTEDRDAIIFRAIQAGTALDPSDRRFRGHGAVRILVLRGGDAMNVQAKHTADATTVEEGLAIAGRAGQAVSTAEIATDVAMQNTLLTPRFYTTDFDELDAIDVSLRARGLGQADRADGSRPQQGPLQEERRLGPCRLGRDGA